ncbi:30S ribosomal protein S12 methylthiotransferase RimO [Phascolarctobacterium faecium]|uniref:30S ribosomal protein S12 methylthiotransferase RimO n=1 Tax=Phascolarctobacterium faecium TaxID=33025 RepID=UPI003A8BB782
MKIGLVSLGCPKNLVDSETMLGLIHEQQITITNDPAEADLIIINTCGFIESAKEESINTILQMGEYKTTGTCKYLIITGCLGQRYAEELLENIPEADAVIGTECYEDIAYVIQRVTQGERFIMLESLKKAELAPPIPAPRILTTPDYMAYLKIAEGCDNCCSYCIIPKLRGPYVSKPFEQVLGEAKALVDKGVKELIVVAQDTTRYGEDLYGKLRLPELLSELNKLEGLKWIRVMYCYPNNFTDDLIEAFASLDKVCKYVDLPLQHASDRLLSSMNRYDTKSEVEALLNKLRQRIPGITIRTTFIVGFPGETEADFQELKAFVEAQHFDNAGVFSYSQEEGTVAADLPEQIDTQIKEERFHELMSLQAQISEDMHHNMEDMILEVLVEGCDEENPDLVFGRSYKEAPNIDGSIFVENAGNVQAGEFIKVKILQGFTYEMVGERI